MNYEQYKTYVIRPSLKAINLWSEDAEALIFGTALVESRLRYIVQLNMQETGAAGFLQIEMPTAKWLCREYIPRKEAIDKAIASFLWPWNRDTLRMSDLSDISLRELLLYDLRVGVILARMKYYSIPQPLPAKNNVAAMGEYWKKYYNASPNGLPASEFVKLYKDAVRW